MPSQEKSLKKQILDSLIKWGMGVQLSNLNLGYHDVVIVRGKDKKKSMQVAELMAELPARCLPRHVPVVVLTSESDVAALRDLSEELKDEIRRLLWEQ